MHCSPSQTQIQLLLSFIINDLDGVNIHLLTPSLEKPLQPLAPKKNQRWVWGQQLPCPGCGGWDMQLKLRHLRHPWGQSLWSCPLTPVTVWNGMPSCCSSNCSVYAMGDKPCSGGAVCFRGSPQGRSQQSSLPLHLIEKCFFMMNVVHQRSMGMT